MLDLAVVRDRRQREEVMRVAFYGRVSTVDKGQDVELQLWDLRRYVEARGRISHRKYVDERISGAKARRLALEALLDDCRKRRVDVVVGCDGWIAWAGA